jgi:hypothetical protein
VTIERTARRTHRCRKCVALCHLVALWLVTGTSADASPCTTGHWILEVLADGKYIKLEDGTIWEVDDVDTVDSALWLPVTNVIACADKIINVDDNETVHVTALSRAPALRNNRASEPAADAQVSRSNGGPSVIESRVDGEFHGWEGDTILKLANGQIWQQREYHYHYHYAYAPKVIVILTESGWKMSVDGTDRPVGVTRLK